MDKTQEQESTHKKEMNLPSHTISIRVDGSPKEFWQYFEPIDLSTIFIKTKILPAVKSSSKVDRWDTPGQRRTVYLESGYTAQEEIIGCKKPNYFKYKVSDFTFALKYICRYAIGEWYIAPEGNETKVVWIYTFYPKFPPFFKSILGLFVRIVWGKYMESSMKNLENGYIKYRKNKFIISEESLSKE